MTGPAPSAQRVRMRAQGRTSSHLLQCENLVLARQPSGLQLSIGVAGLDDLVLQLQYLDVQRAQLCIALLQSS